MWRDIFPGEMHAALLGKTVGEQVRVVLPPGQFFTPYSEKLLIQIKPEQFSLPSMSETNPDHPLPGRFYPQYSLHGVPGIFATSLAPCRFVGRQGGKLLFDLNHPLAGQVLTLSVTVLGVEQSRVERGGRCEDWLEAVSTGGPGMQKRLSGAPAIFFQGDFSRRADERADRVFYQTPRLVQHLDSTARRVIGEEYRRILPPQAEVLDLMASWDSHLPGDYQTKSLTVLGMNEKELHKNVRADAVLVHDLNAIRQLPFADQSFDAIINTASIEYVVDPLQLCREAWRILRPGGLFAISFSNRWFPSKAIALWSQLHEFERLAMVVEMLAANNGFTDFSTLSVRGLPRPDDDPHALALSDPVYMVTARKK